MKKLVLFLMISPLTFLNYAQGGFQKTSISNLSDSSFIFIHQTGANTTGIFVDSLLGNTIDTVTVSNDSVFIHTQNGDSILTGLTYLPSNWGNVLFVSTSGNNTTASKGDPNKAWVDPQSAVDSAQSGDVVWVMAGDYYYGTGGFSVTNLAKPGVAFIASNGVRFLHTGAGFGFSLFTIDQAGEYEIRLNNVQTTTGVGVVEINHNDANVTFEANTILDQGIISTTWRPCFNLLQFDKVKMDIGSIHADSSINATFSIATVNTNRGFCDINIAYANYNYPYKQPDGSARHFLYYTGCQQSEIRFNIGKIEAVAGWFSNNTAAFLYVQSFGGQNKYSILDIDVTVGNFYTIGSIAAANTGVIMFRDDVVTTDTTMQINMNCTYCESEVPIVKHINTQGGGEDGGVVFKVSGKYKVTTSGAYAYSFGGSSKRKWVINAETENEASSSVSISGAPYQIRLSGLFHNSNAGGSVINLTNVPTYGVIIENTILLNDGTAAAVTSNAARNVNCINVYANSTVVDADITEVVGSIVKDVNVK